MGTIDTGGGSGGGMNPAGMMTGMMMGGAMGGQMANMMNQMGQNMQQQQNTPPPLPIIQYNISINGQQSGPYNWQQYKKWFRVDNFKLILTFGNKECRIGN